MVGICQGYVITDEVVMYEVDIVVITGVVCIVVAVVNCRGCILMNSSIMIVL